MKVALLLLAMAAFGRSAAACSTIALPPTRVPDDTVAFEGVVVGYSESSDPIFGTAHAPGLIARVVTPVRASRADSSVEVYLFGSAPDCSPSARSLADLRDQYPVGNAVTVIGRSAAPRAPSALPSVVVSIADGWGHVAAVPANPPRTVEGSLDFSAFSQQHEEQALQGFSLPLAWRNAHRGWYEDFEYLRCLVLLPRLHDDSSKVALLENLKSYSRFGHLTSDWTRKAYGQLVAGARLPIPLEKRLLASPDQP